MMDIYHLYSPGILSGNLLSFKVPRLDIVLPALNMLSSNVYFGKTGMYIEMILLLLVIAIIVISLERMKNKRALQQAEQLRNDIFTRITHEFRTPLTIILGLSKQLRKQKNISYNNSLTYLNAIERQGRYLSELVNQSLDIADLYMADKTMEWKTGNIVAFMEMVSENFRLYTEQKEIDLYFFSDEKKIETDFVPAYLDKILYNLLLNAVKHSDAGGRIYLILERGKKDRKKIIIKVTDHGKGINREILPHIFELFYKYPYTDAETPADNGAGLTLAKQLTEILGGTIKVESEPEKGTTFTVGLPVRKSEKQLFTHWNPEKKTLQSKTETPEKVECEDLFSSETHEDDPRTIILLAEDNKDIALYIRSIFHQQQYNIIYASNGEKAWHIMNHKQLPDIVITDATIPKKNGMQLCKEIKASPLLSHIPVIIISPKNGEADLIESLKSGADNYIRKPFHPEELQICVENLLGNRQLLREKYHRTVIQEEKVKSCDNTRTNFLRHVTDVIYREMKNADFTSAKLAQELAISASQLNKKLNVATGYPTSVYILQVKLDYAKKILSSQNKTIGDVAAECGIYDVNYFSRVFKKYNGITPTQFKRLPPKTTPLSPFAHRS